MVIVIKKLIAFTMVFTIASLMLLSGCQSKMFYLDTGRYTLDKSENDNVMPPYILINEDKFTVVQDIAVSYQPSGTIVTNSNEVVMEAEFAGEKYTWIFTLIDNNKLKLIFDKSNIPNDRVKWKDGMVFVLIEE